MSSLHPNSARVVAAGEAAGLTIDVRRFPEGTRTAQDAANAIGCPLGAIAKSIVVMDDDGPILVLTSGANQVDYDKVGGVLGTTGVRRANADEARAATGYPIGGTPPFGSTTELRTLMDETLLRYDEVWAAAGTPDTVFAIAADQLVRVSGATVADVAQ